MSWHQDSTYWGLSRPDIVTAWVAFSVSEVANGCMRVIPGSHLKDQLPHKDTFAENNLLTRGQEVMVEVDASRRWTSSCSPASSRCTMFASSTDRSPTRPTIGASVTPSVTLPTDVRQVVGERDSATLVRGVDDFHYFDMEPRPKADLDPEAVALHKRITEAANQVLYRGTDKINPK